jgi:hypothetical protein
VFERRIEGGEDRGIDAVLQQFARDPDAEPCDVAGEGGRVIRYRVGGARGVARIGAGNHAEERRQVARRPCERTDLIQ